ncbi:hypothetical protein [uncultured Roseibium sp.]|uniref:hypothetical protein n=1 Tax=uncultured Roseibium sp. TaxID=1936171 RepID=UPI0026385FAC|nr:hypothetical protein [uncultured Roseibium sp.]
MNRNLNVERFSYRSVKKHLTNLSSIQKLPAFAPEDSNQNDQLFVTSLASIRAQLQAEPVRKSRFAGSDFSIDIGFLESVHPNALANKQDHNHIAAMHTGLAMVILEFAWFVMAQGEVFPELGSIEQETSPTALDGIPPGLSVLLQTLEIGGVAETANLTAPIMPNDPHRSAAAYYLALLMMRFVWLHELAHCQLGHIDFLRDAGGHAESSSLGFDELNLNELGQMAPSLDSRILQCLEFEADGYALGQSIAIQVENKENIDGIAALPRDLRLRMALFGICAMSWLMEAMASTFTRGRLAITHPAPIRRLQMAQNMAVWELTDLGLDASEVTRSTLREFEFVLGQIGRQWLQTDKFDPISYRTVFEETRVKLERFRYIET